MRRWAICIIAIYGVLNRSICVNAEPHSSLATSFISRAAASTSAYRQNNSPPRSALPAVKNLINDSYAKKAHSPVTKDKARKIAFISGSEGIDHIYTMDADGTNVTRLTSGPYPESSFSWSPNATQIAFWRQEDGEGIYTMNVDGSHLQRLSPSPGYDIFPSWSPQGKQLVFTRIITPAFGDQLAITQIMIMNSDGTDVRSILDNGTFNMEPRWSPDGSKILFMSTLGDDGVQIYSMNSDGTSVTELTGQGTNGDPSWSPDGSKIAFGSNREGDSKLNIFSMNADGTNVSQLTHFLPPYGAGDTGWSSDGKSIAFEWDIGSDDQSNPNAYAEVWTMNVDGSNEATTGAQCSGVGCCPRWKPATTIRPVRHD